MIKIAIDGPSGAGKSSISKEIANKFNFVYIDTGAMYRGVGLKVLENGIDTLDSQAVILMLHNTLVDIRLSDVGQQVYVDGKNVTDKIRTDEVSIAASNVSAIPKVRLKMVELQRNLAMNQNVIMDGRDIGTYVLPDADVKIYLTADLKSRAKRRYDELILKDSSLLLCDVEHQMSVRDANDKNREFAPLCMADDAILVDTSKLNFIESVDFITKLIKERVKIV